MQPPYYLKHFHHLLNWVGSRSVGFWSEEEKALFAGFRQASVGAQALLVRLLTRKGRHFRKSRLNYGECQPLQAILAELAERQLISLRAGPEDLLPMAALHTCAELAAWLGKKAAKPLLLDQLVQHEDALALLGSEAVLFTQRPLFERLVLLFFGNRHQDLATFVLADLGRAVFPPLPLVPATLPFPNRGCLEDYLLWSDREALLEMADMTHGELGSLARECMAVLDKAHPSWRRFPRRILTRLALPLLQQGHPLAGPCLEALQRAAQSEDRIDWQSQARLVRWLLSRNKMDQAKALLNQAAERSPLERFAHNGLLRRLNPEWPRETLAVAPEHFWPGQEKSAGKRQGKALYRRADQWLTIESLVLALRGEEGWHGCLAENGLIRTLFLHLAWEPFFHPVEGAFFQPFQDAPADWGSRAFFPRRQEAFAHWADQARRGGLPWLQQTLAHSIASRGHYLCRLNHPSHIQHGLLPEILARASSESWVLLALRFFSLQHALHRGFPDLVLLRGEELLLCEVKATGEALSPHQRNWHAELMETGFHVSIDRIKTC